MQSRLGAARAVAVLAIVAAAGAAGCSSGKPASSSGSSGAKLTAAQELAATLRSEQQIKTFDASMSMHVTGIPGAASAGGLTVSGTIEGQRQPSLLEEFHADTMRMLAQNVGPMTEIVTPKAFYMKMPMLSAAMHKPWLELPFSELKGNGAALSQLLNQAQSGDPLSQARLMAGSTNVRTVGTGTVAGVPVTELTGSESANAAIAKLPASTRATLGQEMEKLGVGQIQYQAWVDAQHNIRKLIVKETGSTLNETISMTVTGINKPVSISLPSSAQTATIPASALNGTGL